MIAPGRSTWQRARSIRRSAQAGFTLIELTVALVSGLIVAMGIVGLSREATQTFNDEARSSAAEAGLRAAIERLRADLQRAGYMSTGNILLDPALALIPGNKAGSTNQVAYKPAITAPTNIGMGGLQNLASLYWVDNGSNGGAVTNAISTLSAAQSPALTPDLIQIAGNMTSAEQFDVQLVPRTSAQCSAGGTQIYLSPNSPAMVRTFGGAVPSASNSATLTAILQNIFTPDGTSSFLLRLVDKTAHTQFLAICPPTSANPSAGLDGSLQPYVRVDSVNTPILFSNATGTNISTIGGVGGFCAGCQVNPVQIVQWEITNSSGGNTDNEPASYGSLDFLSQSKTADSAKYDLMRSYLDAKGNFLTATSEIVAEYAVDLSFAFSGDDGTSLTPDGTNAVTSCALDSTACNTLWGQRVSAGYLTSPPQGPQRIRTARARLTTRTAVPDRSVTIPTAPAAYTGQTFLYRYYLPTASTQYPAPLTYARARTVTTEAALPNQARNFF
jgi:type II secretory pathway pseudopilin PulG